MNEVIRYFSCAINYLFTNWIAIVSLGLSFYIIKKDKVYLDIDLYPETQWLKAMLLSDGRSIQNDYGLIQANIRVINSSNYDVSYFDLRVFSGKDYREEIGYHMGAQFNLYNDLENTDVIAGVLPDDQTIILNLPKSNFGILKARSVTSIDLIVTSDVPINEIFVILKTTNRKSIFNKAKIGYVNSPYETFSGLATVEQSKKPN